jgi:hypothetical protein
MSPVAFSCCFLIAETVFHRSGPAGSENGGMPQGLSPEFHFLVLYVCYD